MRIAVASDRDNLKGNVPETFSDSRFILVTELETGEFLGVIERGSWNDQDLARLILGWDCEGVLCGPIEREPFLILADEGGVTRYLAAGLTVLQALNLARGRDLELIRDHIDGDHRRRHSPGGCSGLH